MLTRKSLARTAAATAGLALVATGALAPASADQGKGADRGQSHAAQAKSGDKADRKAGKPAKAGKSAKAEKGQQTAAKSDKGDRGRSETAPHGNAYGHDKEAKVEAKGDARAEKSDNGLGDERGGGHTPVTVCHALGNGGYIEITFDENALKNHLANHMQHKGHMDFVLEEGETCPEPGTESVVEPGDATVDDTDDEGGATTDTTDDGGSDVTRNEETTIRETVTTTQIAGVEAFRARTGAAVEAPAAASDATVAGAEATAPAAVGPVAGILPQTGAAPMALAAVAGLGLVGAGATMVARRRREV